MTNGVYLVITSLCGKNKVHGYVNVYLDPCQWVSFNQARDPIIDQNDVTGHHVHNFEESYIYRSRRNAQQQHKPEVGGVEGSVLT